MHRGTELALALGAAIALAAAPAFAQDHQHGGGERMAPPGGMAQHAPAAVQHAPPAMAQRGPTGFAAMRQGEPHMGPNGYQRPVEPQGWNQRPSQPDPQVYRHNYQAARSFHIGPYRAPEGYRARHWGYGQILPRAYWSAPYLIADYWLFGFEVPPYGYEWVRVGPDAVLVNTFTGEILQVEYGVFAY